MARSAKRFLLSSIVLSTALLALLVSPLPVRAVESFGIGAVPAHPKPNNPRTQSIFVYELKPGSQYDDAVKVMNNTNTRRVIKVYPVDSQHSSDGAFACAQEADKKVTVGTWVTLSKQEITLEPQTSTEVPFTMRVPDDAEPGEHNGCIAVQESKPPQPSGVNGIALSFRSALRVAVTVPGDIRADVHFLEIRSNTSKPKLQLSPILKNEGNVSVDAQISVGLKTIFGMKAAQAGGKFSLLKAEESRFNFEVDYPFWGGWYQKNGSADYVPLRENTADQGAHRTTSITSEWIFLTPTPLALAIEIGIVVVLLGAIIYLIWNRKQHKLLAMRTAHYHVKPGDNLQVLAAQAGISWRKLAKLNKLKPPYTLESGQIIRLPKKKAGAETKSKKQV